MKTKLAWIPLIGQLALLSLEGASPSLQFHGNHSFTDSSLSKRLLQKGLDTATVSDWTKEQVERAARLVQVYYRDCGYPLSSVHFEQGSGKPALKILEGPRTKLSLVSFEGNTSFSDARLVAFFDLGGWFSQGNVDSSLERIRQFYESEGYIRAIVQKGQLKISEESNRSYFPVPFRIRSANCASLRCEISEGGRYRFGKVSFQEGFKPSDAPVPATGEIFQERLLNNMRDGIIRHLRQDERLLKELRVLRDVNEDVRCVDVRVTLEAYPILLIRSIEFAGNHRFSDSFYRRELQMEEKGLFHPLDLDRSLRRLAQTGTLSSLTAQDVELTVNEKTLEVDVLFNLKERERQGIFYSFGPGRYGGLEASLAYSVLNLIGLGEALGLEASSGDATSGIAVRLASRYLIGTDLPVSIALGFFRRHSGLSLPGLDDKISDLFGIREAGVSGKFNYRVRPRQSLGIGASLALRESGERHLVLAPYLREGDRLNISQRVSLIGNSWNLRPSIGWSGRIAEKLEIRMTASHAFFFGDQEPFSERLFIQSRHVRGLALSGPLGIVDEKPARIGGDTLLAFNSEYKVPLAKPVSLVPFLDLGWSANLAEVKKYKLLDGTNKLPRCSTGSELRVKVSRLPELRLIFSWNPLRLIPEESLAQFWEPTFNFRVGVTR